MSDKQKKRRSPLSVALFLVAVAVFLVGLVFVIRQLAFPKAYESIVQEYSSYYEIDENFIFAVINTESGFDENAVSDVGASGLMQIMEDAFLWTKKHLDAVHTDISYEDILSPEYNVEYGCCMLSYYYEKYDSYELSAAAYHAGTNQVDKWIAEGVISIDNFDSDDIPSDATSHYVKKVMRAYKAYEYLY